MDYPPWVVLHLPHDSVEIPSSVRPDFLLDDAGLAREIERMTDHHTAALCVPAETAASVVRATVSRLVVDVERFENDGQEPMAERGMGVIYTATSDLQPLRRPLQTMEREVWLARWYRPHHARLELAVTCALASFGRCLVIDCHSFPDEPLPYEQASVQHDARPDLCIGTDDFHTPASLRKAFVDAFELAGWRVAVDAPFSGSLVPASRYRRDARVMSLMIEVNRARYLRTGTSRPVENFPAVAKTIRESCLAAIRTFDALRGAAA